MGDVALGISGQIRDRAIRTSEIEINSTSAPAIGLPSARSVTVASTLIDVFRATWTTDGLASITDHEVTPASVVMGSGGSETART